MTGDWYSWVIFSFDLNMNSVQRGCEKMVPWFYFFGKKNASFVLNLGQVWQF